MIGKLNLFSVWCGRKGRLRSCTDFFNNYVCDALNGSRDMAAGLG